jgi:hypothetical protein
MLSNASVREIAKGSGHKEGMLPLSDAVCKVCVRVRLQRLGFGFKEKG